MSVLISSLGPLYSEKKNSTNTSIYIHILCLYFKCVLKALMLRCTKTGHTQHSNSTVLCSNPFTFMFAIPLILQWWEPAAAAGSHLLTFYCHDKIQKERHVPYSTVRKELKRGPLCSKQNAELKSRCGKATFEVYWRWPVVVDSCLLVFLLCQNEDAIILHNVCI